MKVLKTAEYYIRITGKECFQAGPLRSLKLPELGPRQKERKDTVLHKVCNTKDKTNTQQSITNVRKKAKVHMYNSLR